MTEKSNLLSGENAVTGRGILALISIAVSTYYLIWRLGTFNPEAMTFSIILYSAEVYGFIITLMFFFMIWRPVRRNPLAVEKGLKVDVYIPTINEDADLLRKTVLGCINMRYPHKTYILDDGRRPEIKALAEELGCGYITRQDNKDAKAGNLNNALKQTDGDYIAVFDADHVPQPDFLDKLLGYFRDKKVAFVQTPQDFYNIDSFQHRITGGKRLWTEQSLFFSVVQPGKDAHNAAFFCGSCAILRREALEDIGGFATGTVTEDFHTTVRIHARRWKSVYHNESLAYGLAAPVLHPFQRQRLRWGQGAMQLFIRDNPIFKRGLTIAQRICHLGSISHYLDGFQKAIYYFMPIAVLTTGILPIKTIDIEFLIIFVPHLLLSLWAYEEMSRGFGRTFLIEQYNMIRFFTYIKSVAGIFKKGLGFKVTPKSGLEKTTSRMLIPQMLIIAGSLLAVIYAVSGLAPYRLESSAIIANIFWAAVNTGLAYAAVKYALNKVQRRNDFRFPVNIPAAAALSNPGIMPLAITDLHEKGAAFSAFKRFEKGAVLPVSLSIAGKTLNAAVRVLHVKQKNISGVSVFYHGTEFVDLPAENRDAITGFNFSYGVNKMMTCLNISKETPLSKLLRLISGRTFLKREERQSVQIPGTYRSNGTQWLPFVTEDISGGGMRISSYTDIRKPVISMNFFYGKECRLLRGKIVWKQDIDLHGSRAYLYGIKFLMESRELVHLSLPGDLPAFNKSYSRRSI